jgi:hypothetical protein
MSLFSQILKPPKIKDLKLKCKQESQATQGCVSFKHSSKKKEVLLGVTNHPKRAVGRTGRSSLPVLRVLTGFLWYRLKFQTYGKR